jgi:hypothetical protein
MSFLSATGAGGAAEGAALALVFADVEDDEGWSQATCAPKTSARSPKPPMDLFIVFPSRLDSAPSEPPMPHG